MTLKSLLYLIAIADLIVLAMYFFMGAPGYLVVVVLMVINAIGLASGDRTGGGRNDST